MLRIPIYIIDGLGTERKLFSIYITNAGTHKERPKYGNYTYQIVHHKGGVEYTVGFGNVKDHLRNENTGALELLTEALILGGFK